MTRKRIATRDSFGRALVELAPAYPELVVLDADLSGATKTHLFRERYPNRHINCGIAEANMMGVAAGLAAEGYLPVASTFAIFAAGRAYEQVRNSIGYPALNVKIGATHGGISVGEDGASHQCNEDIALMRTIPGMTIINPADDIEARAAIKAALDISGPVYLRFGRMPVPVIYEDEAGYAFHLGKGVCLRAGRDITLVCTGLCVWETLCAAEALQEQDIDAEIINIHTIKPLDESIVLKSAQKTRRVVSIEEHSVIGGLGDAVSDVLARHLPTRMMKIGINDVYGESGAATALLEKYGLNAKAIYQNVGRWIREIQ